MPSFMARSIARNTPSKRCIFESYPGFFVTGNLYRPKNRAGKLPVVLCPHGHWPTGDSMTPDPRTSESRSSKAPSGSSSAGDIRCKPAACNWRGWAASCSTTTWSATPTASSWPIAPGDRLSMDTPRQWGFFSPQAEARLQSIFGLQTYDSIRALDFVCSLPEVDPTRIGVTGASGGGTQTFILGAVDPRPAAIFPAVMVSTAMQGGCTCENACYLRIGTGNIELAGLFAPKPLGMSAADDWTKEIAAKGLPELKQLYRLFGAEDLVMAKPLLQFPHNYNYVSRAVMYAWFNKHLKLGFEEPIVEEDFRPLSVAEMSVWDEQHPAPPGGDDFERACSGG